MNWKVGDTVIAKYDFPAPWCFFKKDDELIIDGFSCCPSCGSPAVYIKGINGMTGGKCVSASGKNDGCGRISYGTRTQFDPRYFEKPASFGELINYRKSVTEPEVLKILTPTEIQNH